MVAAAASAGTARRPHGHAPAVSLLTYGLQASTSPVNDDMMKRAADRDALRVRCSLEGVVRRSVGVTVDEQSVRLTARPSREASVMHVRAALLACVTMMAIGTSAGPALAAEGGQRLSPAAVGYQPSTWTVVPSPNKDVLDNEPLSVSCVSTSTCMAVGFDATRSGGAKTLTESWNGTTWTVVPSPNKNSQNLLRAVSCTSVSACIAVGYSYSAHSEPKTLVESWNGTAWTIVPSPNPAPGLGQDYLEGVSCTSATACTAAGWIYTRPATGSSKVRTLIASWNGTAWSHVSSPNPGPAKGPDYLNAVSCASASSCTAVGNDAKGELIESWNGTTWSAVPSPSGGSSSDVLYGVSCTAATACTAVGNQVTTGNVQQTLTESWDGTSWSIVPSPNEGTSSNSLSGVSCTTATDCVAVGFEQDSTLVESWDGTSWSITPSPNSGASSSLGGVSCTSLTTCTAAGLYSNHVGSEESKSLIESGT
jgi:hypothetical protein